MGTEPQYPETAASLGEINPEERADVAEDRRRQRELDDGELGGEA